MRNDLDPEKLTFNCPIAQDKRHVTHQYLQNLITGNFVDHGLTQYINDYNFFIGNDIKLPLNEACAPFPSSLKWQIFQKNRNFFLENIDRNNSVRDFLYCDISKMSDFERKNIIFIETAEVGVKGYTDEAVKLSICYPYIMDYQQVLEKNEKVMSLEFNNCIIENLELTILLEYFPKLHTLMIKNSYIKEITDDDYQTILTRFKPKKLRIRFDTTGIPKLRNYDISVEEMRILRATVNDNEKTRKELALRNNGFSFFIDFKGSVIRNISHLITDHDLIADHTSTEKKPITIRNLWHKNLIFQRLRFYAKSIMLFVLVSGLNILIIKKLLKNYPRVLNLPILIAYITLSCIIKASILFVYYQLITAKTIFIER